MDGARARDGLDRVCALLSESRRVRAQDQLCCCGGELYQTGNRKVFVVQGWVISEDVVGLAGLSDDDCSFPRFLLGVKRCGRTFLTTGSTHGFALLSLYAPIPRSTFLSKVSARYAAINPKSGSSGAWGTASAGKLVDCDITLAECGKGGV